jgi:hypothetical protein
MQTQQPHRPMKWALAGVGLGAIAAGLITWAFNPQNIFLVLIYSLPIGSFFGYLGALIDDKDRWDV